MTKKERLVRWILRLSVGEHWLGQLDDAQALAAMLDAHAAFRRLKAAEAAKEAAKRDMNIAGDELMLALTHYAEIADLPDRPTRNPIGFLND